MDRQQPFHCFVFDDNAVIDKHIDPVSRIESEAAVNNRKCHFTNYLMPFFTEFMGKTNLICRFQETWPKSRMHPNRSQYHFSSRFL